MKNFALIICCCCCLLLARSSVGSLCLYQARPWKQLVTLGSGAVYLDQCFLIDANCYGQLQYPTIFGPVQDAILGISSAHRTVYRIRRLKLPMQLLQDVNYALLQGDLIVTERAKDVVPLNAMVGAALYSFYGYSYSSIAHFFDNSYLIDDCNVPDQPFTGALSPPTTTATYTPLSITGHLLALRPELLFELPEVTEKTFGTLPMDCRNRSLLHAINALLDQAVDQEGKDGIKSILESIISQADVEWLSGNLGNLFACNALSVPRALRPAVMMLQYHADDPPFFRDLIAEGVFFSKHGHQLPSSWHLDQVLQAVLPLSLIRRLEDRIRARRTIPEAYWTLLGAVSCIYRIHLEDHHHVEVLDFLATLKL